MNYKKSLSEYYNSAPTFESISSDKLVSGQDYQRKVKDKNILKIINNFNPMKFDPPTVVYRDGRYYLVDGQHRISSLVFMNGGKPTNILCKVFRGADYGMEVNTVTHHDDGHTAMSILEHINAAARGTDDEATLIREFLLANGKCDVTLTSDQNNNTGSFVAAKTLLACYKKYGATIYCRVIKLLNETWEGASDSKKNQIITAMFAFDQKYYGKYDPKKFKRMLSRVSCQQTLTTAKTMPGTMQESIVQIFVGAYNKNSPAGMRL